MSTKNGPAQSAGDAMSEGRLLSLKEVAARGLIPPRRRGSRVHVSTLVRWITHGVGGVKLRAVRVGGQWAVSQDWLVEFFEACAARRANQPAPCEPTVDDSKLEREGLL